MSHGLLGGASDDDGESRWGSGLLGSLPTTSFTMPSLSGDWRNQRSTFNNALEGWWNRADNVFSLPGRDFWRNQASNFTFPSTPFQLPTFTDGMSSTDKLNSLKNAFTTWWGSGTSNPTNPNPTTPTSPTGTMPTPANPFPSGVGHIPWADLFGKVPHGLMTGGTGANPGSPHLPWGLSIGDIRSRLSQQAGGAWQMLPKLDPSKLYKAGAGSGSGDGSDDDDDGGGNGSGVSGQRTQGTRDSWTSNQIIDGKLPSWFLK